jgi:hypothetical protein
VLGEFLVVERDRPDRVPRVGVLVHGHGE